MSIEQTIKEIHINIRAAQERSRHAAPQVKLLAVSKTKPIAAVEEAWHSGQQAFGENRVQELVAKQQALPQAEWHLIGHLQSNKVRQIVGKVELIHSLDSLPLAAEIEKRSAAAGITTNCLVQVNIADEESKSGISSGEVADFVAALADFPHIKTCGLMTIGPFNEDAEQMRPIFAELRQLFLHEQAKKLSHTDFRWLSMGMSNDYQVAIEEGANIVRIGSTIFGSRNYI